MVMLWLLSLWEKAGCPSPVKLIELGPGTGVMMTDMLRVRLCYSYNLIFINHKTNYTKQCLSITFL